MLHLKGHAEAGASTVLFEYKIDENHDVGAKVVAVQSKTLTTDIVVTCEVTLKEDAIVMSWSKASLWAAEVTPRFLAGRVTNFIAGEREEFEKFQAKQVLPALQLRESVRSAAAPRRDQLVLSLPSLSGFWTNSWRLLEALGLAEGAAFIESVVKTGAPEEQNAYFRRLRRNETFPQDGSGYYLIYNTSYALKSYNSALLSGDETVSDSFALDQAPWEDRSFVFPSFGFGRSKAKLLLTDHRMMIPTSRTGNVEDMSDRLQKQLDRIQAMLRLPGFLSCSNRDGMLVFSTSSLPPSMLAGCYTVYICLDSFAKRALRFTDWPGRSIRRPFVLDPGEPITEESLIWSASNNPLVGLSSLYPLIVTAPDADHADFRYSYATGVGSLISWCYIATDGSITSDEIILQKRLCRLLVAFHGADLQRHVFDEDVELTLTCLKSCMPHPVHSNS
jgi:hypothetical protein